MKDNKKYFVHRLGRWEAISFLVLLFIAMPLKYGMDMPMGVRVIGIIHGALFSMYLIALYVASKRYAWKKSILAWSFIAALLPMGPFFIEAKLRSSK